MLDDSKLATGQPVCTVSRCEKQISAPLLATDCNGASYGMQLCRHAPVSVGVDAEQAAAVRLQLLSITWQSHR